MATKELHALYMDQIASLDTIYLMNLGYVSDLPLPASKYSNYILQDGKKWDWLKNIPSHEQKQVIYVALARKYQVRRLLSQPLSK